MDLKPIVKWAGGKRQIMDKIRENMPKNYKTYFEPFVGGGALLFALEPKNAVINDVNQELILIYRCLQDSELFELLIKELDKHQTNHSEEYFYHIRALDRDPRFELQPNWKRAARAIYLNKACFNGLFRVNTKGYFNVPFGKKTSIHLYDKENIEAIHSFFLNNSVYILNGDFVEACRTAKAGDFVYFDPPYDTFNDKDTFTAYSKFDFTKEDQIRLAECFKDLTNRGVKCLLSNHNTFFIRELYKDFRITIIQAKRMINSDATGRGNVEEVLIANYEE